jgi:hypothetical protein
MFKKTLDYDALWDEIENDLDTDVAIEKYQDNSEYQNIHTIHPSHHHGYDHRPIYDPIFFIFFPHRRHFF